MAKLTFNGGVHPYDGKDMSKDFPIKDINPVSDLIYPLSQHIGAPATPVVKKGDHVYRGQMIACASSFVSSPIYSSVSGTVVDIAERRVATGGSSMSIIIKNDELYEDAEGFPVKPLEEMSGEEIINRVKEAGIVGMGVPDSLRM